MNTLKGEEESGFVKDKRHRDDFFSECVELYRPWCWKYGNPPPCESSLPHQDQSVKLDRCTIAHISQSFVFVFELALVFDCLIRMGCHIC